MLKNQYILLQNSRAVIFLRLLILAFLMCFGNNVCSKTEVELLVYDEGFQWAVSRQEIDRRLSMVERSGAVIYSPSIWLGDGAIFESKVTPRSPRLNGVPKEWDPVKYLIETARGKNIRIFFNMLVNRRQPSRYQEMTAKDREFFRKIKVADFSIHYFDVRDSEYRRAINNIVDEILQRYKPDGIIMDYIRTGGICNTLECKKTYSSRYNSSLEFDALSYKVNEFAKKRLTTWQVEPVLGVVEIFKGAIDKHDLNTILLTTSSPHKADDVDNVQGRHTHEWLRGGLIDGSIVMDYSSGPKFDLVLKNSDKGLNEFIMIGNYKVVNGQMKALSKSEFEKRLVLAEKPLSTKEKVTMGVYLLNLMTEVQVNQLSHFIREMRLLE